MIEGLTDPIEEHEYIIDGLWIAYMHERSKLEAVIDPYRYTPLKQVHRRYEDEQGQLRVHNQTTVLSPDETCDGTGEVRKMRLCRHAGAQGVLHSIPNQRRRRVPAHKPVYCMRRMGE